MRGLVGRRRHLDRLVDEHAGAGQITQPRIDVCPERPGRDPHHAGLVGDVEHRVRQLGRRPEAAGDELARIPGRRTGSPLELTDAERRIAALVAEGRTNRAVAAELTLRVKTIEVTLTRVYEKLGVRSRSELAARMARARD
jgi:DNA-binding CsgD family transcriptional regulator